jgi:hypothetical protein
MNPYLILVKAEGRGRLPVGRVAESHTLLAAILNFHQREEF